MCQQKGIILLTSLLQQELNGGLERAEEMPAKQHNKHLPRSCKGKPELGQKATEMSKCWSKIRTAQNLASVFFCFYLMGVALQFVSGLEQFPLSPVGKW